MKKEISVLVMGMFLLSFVSAETNISILYGENDSGSEVPLSVDSDGKLKINLNWMNVTTGDLTVLGNLTFGEKITFTLGEMIDNIVDNWIRITGNLNVTDGNLSLGGKTLENVNGKLVWGGVDVDTNISVLYGQNDSGSAKILSVDPDRKLNLKITNLKSSIWEIVGGVTQLVTSGNVFIDGNLNVTGNLSGGSPVKIVGGLRAINNSGDEVFFINSTSGNLNFSVNLKVGGSGETCSSANEGVIKYNSSFKKMQFCNGSAWLGIQTFPRIEAVGGTITTTSSGGINYKIHTFTTNGSFNVTYADSEAVIEYLVVGGGGGEANDGSQYYGGGGGGGGFRTGSGFVITVQNYNITVGAGGVGIVSNSGSNGGSSVLGYGLSNNVTSIGGGGGGRNDLSGLNGASGGGGGGNDVDTGGGAGTAGQGNNGGNSYHTVDNQGGGGGAGAGGTGGDCTGTTGGTGGAAKASSISGSTLYYAGGGAGKMGASGGGGQGSNGANYNNIANRGMGGQYNNQNGGSGIVIVRYVI